MTSPTPQQLLSHCARLKSERAAAERQWREIAAYMRPQHLPGLMEDAAGSKRSVLLLDSTARLAVEGFAAGLYGMMTNPASRWFALGVDDPDLNGYDPVRDWLWDAETRLLASFGPQASRFYAVLPGLFADLACFGTAVFHSEEIGRTGRFNDTVRPLSECLIAENAHGEVDTVFRRFTLTPAQAVGLFGEALSARTRKAAAAGSRDRIAFLHAVFPDTDPAALHPFASLHVEEEASLVVSRSGYFDMPYQVPRWTQGAGEAYGRGIGDQILPDMRLLVRMEETVLRAAELMADPPMAVPDKGLARGAHVRPGGISYGALDHDGGLRIKPIYTGANPAMAVELIEQRRQAVRDAFQLSLMQLTESPNMTATEFMARHEEKLRLLGPNLGRIQSEFLSPLIRRRFGMMRRAGLMPEPPPEIRGHELKIDYVSPLARAQMASEAQAVGRLYDSIAPLTALAPEVADNIDHDEAVQVLGRGWAVPARIMRDINQVRAARAVALAGAAGGAS
jgi:hypothetical protein